MFYCEDCGTVFAPDKIIRLPCDDKETSFQYVKKICPNCFSDFFSELVKCKRCGKYTKEVICPECTLYLKNELEKFLNNYTIDEQEAMLCG